MRRAVAPLVLTAVLLATTASRAGAQATPAGPSPQGPQTTFRSGVEVVTVTAAVRDGRGRVVRNLKQADFQVIDSGQPVQIRTFDSGESPISLAVMLDISGSMAVGGNIDRARHAIEVAMGNLRGLYDEAALYTFDSTLQEVVAFTDDLDRIRRVSLAGKPWGLTSLYDAIAKAAMSVAERANKHRALLVITDGVDTGSKT